MNAFTAIPPADAIARFKQGFGPRFLVTMDTEEEFDWAQPFQRKGHTLHHLGKLREFQNFCEEHGIAPVYLVDYPVATSSLAAAALADAAASGRAEVGIHLHPWVTPPHDEEVSDRNSFAGNLPPALEGAKIGCMKEELVSRFGVEPRIFRAGRYGVGSGTDVNLHRHAIGIDSSVRARFDYSDQHGPDFTRMPARPYWIGTNRSILELPLTTVFTGPLRRLGDYIFPALRRLPRLRGILSRFRLLERIPLTPEGVSAKDAIRAIDRALEEGLPLLVIGCHSPSLEPGHTPYVRDQRDLDQFFGWWKAIIAHCATRGVQPTDISGIMQAVELDRAYACAGAPGKLVPAAQAGGL